MPSASLQLIEDQASSQGVWHAVDAKSRAADVALSTSRVKYLEQQCVLEAAEGLANEAEALLATLGLADVGAATTPAQAAAPSAAGPGPGTGLSGGGAAAVAASTEDDPADVARAHAALRDAGLSCGPATYQSLSKHLQVGRALQRLQLPDVAGPGVAARKTPGGGGEQQQQQQQQTDADPERDGSPWHLLGVTPDTLRLRHCLHRAAAQRAHAGAAREVEGRLLAAADAMVAAVMGDDAAGDSSAAAQAVQSVRDAVAAVEATEAENGRLLRRHAELCRGYLGTLGDIHAALLALVEGCLLGKQARLDAEHCRWLVSHVKTLHSKLRVLQAQLHVATYTSESVPALRAIASTLAAEEEEARATIERVSAQLLAYQECGPEFADIVCQYSQVKDELAKVEHALHHFSQLEMELNDA